MDLIGDKPTLDIGDREFRIYSRNIARAPQFIGSDARVINSMISEGSIIKGVVENSILSGGVTVEEGATVRDSIIMDDVKIGKGAVVSYSIIDSETEIGENVSVGQPKSDGAEICVIAKGSVITDKGVGE